MLQNVAMNFNGPIGYTIAYVYIQELTQKQYLNSSNSNRNRRIE